MTPGDLTFREREELDRLVRAELNVGTKTGYYGRPNDGQEHRSDQLVRRKVHVFKAGVPVCRAPVHPEAVFVWCAPGVERRYVDCGNCRRWVRKWERRVVDDFLVSVRVRRRRGRR